VERCALQMTENPTPAEEALWTVLEPLGFKRQVVIVGYTKNGGEWQYIADFAKLDLMDGIVVGGLIVEADGGIHRKRKGRDRRRGSRLAGEGIKTIRFTNREVLRDLGEIAFKMRYEVENR
jgi:very-short-patch-repair endonuclease